jgi:hypothetical protein
MAQKVLFLVNTSRFKKITIVIPIKGLWLFLKNKVFTTFEPCLIFNQLRFNYAKLTYISQWSICSINNHLHLELS